MFKISVTALAGWCIVMIKGHDVNVNHGQTDTAFFVLFKDIIIDRRPRDHAN